MAVTEAVNARPTRLVDIPITRRAGLILATLMTAAGMSGCVKVDENCGAYDCFTRPPLELPDSFRTDLAAILNPLRGMMASPYNNFSVGFHESEGGAIGGLSTGTNVLVFLPDASPAHLETGKKIAYHEANHVFDLVNDDGPSNYMEEQIRTRVGRNEYAIAELDVLGESAYGEGIGDAPYELDDNRPKVIWKEMQASVLTVMKFYPAEFMQKISTFPADSKRLLATTGLVALDSYIEHSAVPVTYEDLSFSPDLIAFLQRESQ